MKTAFLIAYRYLFSKKKTNFINVISIFSLIGVAVGTMSLIIVLSVFNGLEHLIRSLYGSFDPEIKITAVKGKSFPVNSHFLNGLRNLEGVGEITEIVEDNALVRYKDKQLIVRLKGVGQNFTKQNKIDSMVIIGKSLLSTNATNTAIVGRGIQYRLGLTMDDFQFPLQIWYPRNKKSISLNPENAFNKDLLFPSGVFTIEKQYDDHFIFAPLAFAEKLMEYSGKRTALEVKAAPGFSVLDVQNRIKNHLGASFSVLNSDEQHASLLKAIKIEKMFVFLTFAFILAIASINIFFTLTLLAIEKQKDVSVLFSMGASRNFIKTIFLFEGGLIAFIGAGVGLLLGFIICWVQQTFKLISMGMKTSVIDAYPVLLDPKDFAITAGTVILITILSSYSPAHQASLVDIKAHL
jgi:lipoprotein-releasing system permease protein